MKQDHFKSEALTDINSYYRISNSLLYIKRTHFCHQSQLDFIVFADFWCLIFLPAHSFALNISVGKSELNFKGPLCVYVPPHSIIKWIRPAGKLEWHALMSTKSLETTVLDPVALSTKIEIEKILTEESVSEWLNESAGPQTQIGLSHSPSIVADRVKKWIDYYYRQDLLISEIATSLRVSNAYISREFKKNFGLNPIEYRNKKRIFKAMQLLLFNDRSANSIAHDVGFNDYSRFKNNFNQLMDINPSDFKKGPLKKLLAEN